ncbi:MAG: MoaD/ThiS family protein [Euryarchaeota archaeon]|nr:MoaD/ThiS family protein [Euryarchaeota archaeon]
MIRIRFFAGFRDEVGKAEIEVEPRGGATLGELLEGLKENYPGLGKVLEEGNAIFALNQEVVEANTRVKDGDEVAVFPPVSGG